MKIEWTKQADDLHTGKAGKLFEALVTPIDSEWMATVTLVSRDGDEEIDYDQALRSTAEEAKQAAQASVDYALRRFVEAAVIAEREACAQIARDRSRWAADGAAQLAARDEAAAIEQAIRARGAGDSEP